MGDPDFVTPPDHDQRGALLLRVSEDGIDMGAFESQIAPVDFDDDAQLNCADVDAIVAAIVTAKNPTQFDLTGDDVVDQADLDVWLALAGLENLPTHKAYLLGDADLDGLVITGDLNTVGLNWHQDVTGSCSGDFNADGRVDAKDLNALAINWNKDVLDLNVAPNERVPRAPFANRVVAAVAQQDAPTPLRDFGHDQPRNSGFETDNAAFADLTARRQLRRYAVWSKAHAHQELSEIGQERLIDEVLRRW